MRVERAALRDFRNWERGELEVADGLTVICGPNGVGKTNLLEAVYFGLVGRSCRTSNEREVVRHGAPAARVTVATSAEGVAHSFEAALEPGRNKQLRVDGAEPTAESTAAARPPVAVFSPDRLELVKGPPAHRRAHLDRFVAALWPSRVTVRTEYSRALGQRNALVARARAGAASATQLVTWDVQLARCAIALMHVRAEAVEQLAEPFARRAGELGLPSGAEVRYRPRSRADDEEGLVRELEDRREHDLERGFTTHGPHRDELALTLAGRGLRPYGSQGQQRLGALALLFAERDVLGARGRPPLMLLDDVMSELDRERRERLVDLIRTGGQAVVTATDPEHVPGAEDTSVMLTLVADGCTRTPARPVAA